MHIHPRYTTMEAVKYDRVAAAMKAVPAATHAEFAQYDGYWDDWVLVTLKRNVELKGGRGLEFWQMTIGVREPADDLGPESWKVYSPQRNCNVGRIPLDDVVEVARV